MTTTKESELKGEFNNDFLLLYRSLDLVSPNGLVVSPVVEKLLIEKINDWWLQKRKEELNHIWQEMIKLFPFSAQYDFLPEIQKHKMKGHSEVLLELRKRLLSDDK